MHCVIVSYQIGIFFGFVVADVTLMKIIIFFMNIFVMASKSDF